MKIYGIDGYVGSMLTHIQADDTVIYLPWPSSVKGANRDPQASWDSLNTFQKMLDQLQPHERLIYASSCSVYDALPGVQDEECHTFNLKNWYDFTKRTMDDLAHLSGKHTYGLRFATVNGWSPCLRVDVMMNKMAYDAVHKGEVMISNSQLTRPVLGMSDLVRAIEAICASKEDKRGIYNLASFAQSVEEYGKLVAEHYNVPLKVLDGDPAYAWSISVDKFKKAYDFEFKDTSESVLKSLEKPWLKTVDRA